MAVSNLSNGQGVIQSLGIGSGLDIQSLVTQLVAADGAPDQTRITNESSKLATDISSLGQLKGALSSFQSVITPLKSSSTLSALSATSSNTDTFTASADATATPGSYTVEVTQLAKAEQIVSQNFTNGASTVIGSGTLSITVGGKSMNLALESNSNTLSGIRDQINNAVNNPGVQAAIMSDSTGARLVLTGTSTGVANTIRITTSGDAGLAQLAYAGGTTASWTNNQTAQSSIVKIAGVSFTNDTNTVSSVLTGVTLNLKAEAPGTPYSLTVATNPSSIVANVQAFINGYNTMQKVFTQLTGYDSSTSTGGPMQGDPLAVGLANQMRRLSFDTVPGLGSGISSLAALGVTSDTNGQLSLDQSKLNSALTLDPNIVNKLFIGTNGIATRLDTALTGALASNGSISARDTANAYTQKTIDLEKSQLSDRLNTIQTRYLEQFNALDTLMSQMKTTSNYLTQQFNALTKTTSSTG
jgi:flagellar hook-associated protein 2